MSKQEKAGRVDIGVSESDFAPYCTITTSFALMAHLQSDSRHLDMTVVCAAAEL